MKRLLYIALCMAAVGGWPPAHAQSTVSVTMPITANMIESSGSQVSAAPNRSDADSTAGLGTSFGSDSTAAAAWPAFQDAPAWDTTGAPPDARSQYIIDIQQHAPVTVLFDAGGRLEDAKATVARIFTSGQTSEGLTADMLARLINGGSISLTEGRYFFSLSGDLAERDQSVGVYEGVFTLTLVY